MTDRDSIDPRRMAEKLLAIHGDQAITEALICMARCNAGEDYVGTFRWEQTAKLLMSGILELRASEHRDASTRPSCPQI